MYFLKTFGLLTTLAMTVSALPGVPRPSPSPVAITRPIVTQAQPHPAQTPGHPQVHSPIPVSPNPPTATGTNGKGITIINNLAHPVYLWSTAETTNKNMVTINKKGGRFHEAWRTNPNGGGISIKLSQFKNLDSVLQFEYTLSGPKVFYDMSSINLGLGSLFVAAGFGVRSADPGCPVVHCAPGIANCADSYQRSWDNDTLACLASSPLTLRLG